MKAFIFDHGHEGAEIYFSRSYDNAVEHFRQGEIQRFEKAIENLEKTDFTVYNKKYIDKDIENYRYRIECVKLDTFLENIESCEIVEGEGFWTMGSY